MDREQKRNKAKQGFGRAKMIWERDLAWTIGFPIHWLEPELASVQAGASVQVRGELINSHRVWLV